MTERPHFTNDGCSGQPEHELTVSEGRQIREMARQILVDAIVGRDDDAVGIGRSVALHYGTQGEWLLSCLLVEYVRRGDNGAPRAGTFSLPQLSLRVPGGDTQADRLLCALSDPKAPLDSPAERGALLDAMRLPVQEFMIRAHEQEWQAARAVWTAVYSDDANPLRRLAFTALLVLWAARCTLPPTVPAQRTRQEAAG
jgi:hypothetical protein